MREAGRERVRAHGAPMSARLTRFALQEIGVKTPVAPASPPAPASPRRAVARPSRLGLAANGGRAAVAAAAPPAAAPANNADGDVAGGDAPGAGQDAKAADDGSVLAQSSEEGSDDKATGSDDGAPGRRRTCERRRQAAGRPRGAAPRAGRAPGRAWHCAHLCTAAIHTMSTTRRRAQATRWMRRTAAARAARACATSAPCAASPPPAPRTWRRARRPLPRPALPPVDIPESEYHEPWSHSLWPASPAGPPPVARAAGAAACPRVPVTTTRELVCPLRHCMALSGSSRRGGWGRAKRRR